MNLLQRISFFLFAASTFSACSEEEYVYPDLITEMVCLKTDSNGCGTQLFTDEGKTWQLSKDYRPDSLTADSIYRIYSRYAPLSDTEAKAYTLQKTISPLPKPGKEFENIKTDPVSIQSIWRSGDYLNMVVQVMMKDKNHDFAFIENSIEDNKDGTKTLVITLYHDRKEDVEAFNRKAYLSIPLWSYRGKLNKGDKILFHLNTYEEGMTVRNYTY